MLDMQLAYFSWTSIDQHCTTATVVIDICILVRPELVEPNFHTAHTELATTYTCSSYIVGRVPESHAINIKILPPAYLRVGLTVHCNLEGRLDSSLSPNLNIA